MPRIRVLESLGHACGTRRVCPTRSKQFKFMQIQVEAKPKGFRRDLVQALKSDPQRARWLRDSLKCFTLLRKNIYLERKRKQPLVDEMEKCQCKIDSSGQQGNLYTNCRQKCLNRMICTECDDEICPCGALCENRKFQNHEYSIVYPKPCSGKGWGLCAGELIKKGQFIMQYIGEVFTINGEEGKKRCKKYSESTCTYLMKISKGEVIDPTDKGNLARFINHSCDPNSITQKWNVLGEICVGIYALRDIEENEELTFDYQFDAFNTPLTKCLCGTSRCKGYLGLRPTNITAEEWEQRLECMICQICSKTYEDDDVTLIICDCCNHGFHIHCLTPQMTAIPKDAFFCDNCKLKMEQEREQKLRQKEAELCRRKELALKEAPYTFEKDVLPEPANYKIVMDYLEEEEKKAIHEMLVTGKSGGMDDQLIKVNNQPGELLLSAEKQRQEKVIDLSKRASQKLGQFLKDHPEITNELNKFIVQPGTNEKKTVLMSRVGMHLFRSNFSLFQKIEAKIFWDHSARNMHDAFFKHLELTVSGNAVQLSLFEQLVNAINQVVHMLENEMGITEAEIQVPAIFLKRLNGPGNLNLSQIERSHSVTVFYNKRFINDECYQLDVCAKLMIKGDRANIVNAFEDIKKRLAVLEVERIFVNPFELKAIIQHITALKRRRDLAEFRIAREPAFREVNHPFFFMQERLKEVAIIGSSDEVRYTKRELLNFMEEGAKKEQFYNLTSVHLAPFQLKQLFSGLKVQVEKEVPGVKIHIFDPIPPRKNMTISMWGGRELRVRAKEVLLRKLDILIKENQFAFNFDLFQDQMSFQMTKYLFKYLQNAFLTKDPAFMKNWDIYTTCFGDDNYLFRAVKKQLFSDTQTLLYACYSLPPHAMKHLLKECAAHSGNKLHEELFPKIEVLELIRQNMVRLLNFTNVQVTAGLRNIKSVMNYRSLRKQYKEYYGYLNWEERERSRRQSRSRQKKRSSTSVEGERAMSVYERALLRRRRGLKQLLNFDQCT